MRTPKYRLTALVLALFMAAACTGCMTASVDELYSLPRMSEEYVQLQELIAQRIDAGSAYAAPTGGRNRQSIQLRDLDADGTAEALAFLVDDDRTPTVCVYRRNADGDFSRGTAGTIIWPASSGATAPPWPAPITRT